MIEREFEAAEGAKAVGFSHSDFGLVVQAFHNAAGKQLLSPEIIEDQLAVLTHGTGDPLHRLDTGSHHLTAPFVEELSSPGGGVVIPELLKSFLKKVGPNGLQVVAEQIAGPEALFGFQFRHEVEAVDLLHGLDTGAHRLTAPFVEELSSPGGGVVIPELLKSSSTN